MSKRVIATLLLSAVVLSFACDCQNMDIENTSNASSKAESQTTVIS